jgi:hypothetical protein
VWLAGDFTPFEKSVSLKPTTEQARTQTTPSQVTTPLNFPLLQ